MGAKLSRHKPQQQSTNNKTNIVITESKPGDNINSTNVPLCGISLAYLRTLNIDGNKTSYNICDEFIIPQTKTLQCSYAELLLSDPSTSHHVSDKANIFISYAWGYLWQDILSCLADVEENSFIWIDCFVVNQHTSSESYIDTWLDTFTTAISKIGNVMILVTPWSKPINVTRAWCVFEILVSLTAKVKTIVKVPLTDEENLREMIKIGTSIQPNIIQSWWNDLQQINVMRAMAFKESDRIAIMKKISTFGAVNVNDVIMKPIKDFVERVGKETMEKYTSPHSVEHARAVQFYSLALVNNGKGDEALKVAEQAVKIFRNQTPEATEEEKHNSLFWYGSMQAQRGMWPEAVKTMENVLAWSRANLREHHPLTIASMQMLATGLIFYSRFDESNAMSSEVIRLTELEYGTEDEHVINALLAYGAILNSLSKVKKAKRIFTTTLERCRKTLPPDHPSTILTMHNLAVLKKRTGEFNEALELLNTCLFHAERTSGKESSAYADVLELMASLYLARNGEGDLDEAIKIGQQALTIFRKTLPPSHQQLSVSTMRWGNGKEATRQYGSMFATMEAQSQVNDVDDGV
jgi:tetratricopeptide (TPR) repeat protein